MLTIDLRIGDISASFNSAANVSFITQSLDTSVKIGAKISTLSLSMVILIPVVVFFGFSFLIFGVSYSALKILNSNKVSNLLLFIAMIWDDI